MDSIINFISENFIYILVLVVLYFLLRKGIFQTVWSGVSPILTTNAWPLVIGIGIVTLAFVTVWQPDIFAFFFGPARQTSQARASLDSAVLHPGNDPASWPNPVARQAATAMEAEYQAKTAHQLANVSAAEADRACRLPKGHAERVLWDDADIDPCRASWPSGIQAVANKLSMPADWEDRLSKPLGPPPAGAQGWIKDIYLFPSGIILIAGLGFIVVLLRLFR